MRRMHIFLIFLIVALAILVTLALVSWYLAVAAPSYYGSSWMRQMWGGMAANNNGGMGGMMGNNGGAAAASASYLWIIPAVLIAVVAAAIIGVGFYLAFPELKYIKGAPCNPQKVEPAPSVAKEASPVEAPVSPHAETVLSALGSCDLLLKTMTPEEQKVLNVLIAHKGKYLQKYVVKEAGLSRLKTHRIVARFTQRGIVTVKEFGNTNEIQLSDWVKSSNPPAG
jgi:uncharacterized membrane protein